MKIKTIIRGLLFKIIKFIIRKYFNDGLNPIYGPNENEYANKIIAWKWVFYDEQYEKDRFLIKGKEQ